MANNNKNKNKEPSTAPQPDIWYNLTLGSSFKDNSSTKFCTLRYESKPASIDKSQTGSLHKSKDNKVTVEFQSNQHGKPKWLFEGSSEEYKDNDAVLFFHGETFRLERLHRAMKRLRRGDMDGRAIEARSPPVGRGSKGQSSIKAVVNSVPVEMERIDIGEPKSPGLKSTGKGVLDNPSAPPFTSPEPVDLKSHELEEDLNMLFDDVDSDETPDKANAEQEINTGFDINIPNQNDAYEEIADVDVSDDEAGNRPNAAETLRAQVNAEGSGASTSSSSESSGSGSSGSGSGSSSSSDSSEDDSVSSI